MLMTGGAGSHAFQLMQLKQVKAILAEDGAGNEEKITSYQSLQLANN
jgi:hypothetical protein